MELDVFVTTGLGDSTYLLASGGEAVLVDPQRDAWRFLETVERRGLRLRAVLETHVHNDYVSGALEARAATGAEIVAPARGGYAFEHRDADEGDGLDIGALRVTAMATPGHTPEHLAWAVTAVDGAPDATAPVAVFTGGSLLVGSAGRTDLLGPAMAGRLAADQQRSLRRLAALPPSVRILPTHGAGSFCSTGPTSDRRETTIALELAGNPTVAALGEPEPVFVAHVLADLPRHPAYYAAMAPINRAGPPVLGGLRRPPALGPAELDAAVGAGAVVVDARDRRSFAAAHIPGSVNVELDDGFAGYVGWCVEFGRPLVLVVPSPEAGALAEATLQLFRVGWDAVEGWLDGGIGRWQASGRETRSHAIVSAADAFGQAQAEGGPLLLDVRQPAEWRAGSIPGSRRIFLGDLPARMSELPKDRPITVLCQSGYRASIAGSLLDAAGYDVRVVARGGVPRWPGPLERPAPEPGPAA